MSSLALLVHKDLAVNFRWCCKAAADAETDIRMNLDGQEERTRYITETGSDLVIGIVGQYLDCFDSKSRFKLLHNICVSKLPNSGRTSGGFGRRCKLCLIVSGI